MIKNVALLNDTGEVVNVIVIDDARPFSPSAGLTIFDNENAAIGDTVIDGVLVKPDPPAEEEEAADENL